MSPGLLMRPHARRSCLSPAVLISDFRRMLGIVEQFAPMERSIVEHYIPEDIVAEIRSRSKTIKLREKRSLWLFRFPLLMLENALTTAEIMEVESPPNDLPPKVQTPEGSRRRETRFVEFCNTHNLGLAEPGEVDDAPCVCFNMWLRQSQQAHGGDKKLASLMFMDPCLSLHGDSK